MLQDKYHVTFFGIQATRAWIGKKFIKVYNPDDKEDQLKYVSFSGYKCVFIVFIVYNFHCFIVQSENTEVKCVYTVQLFTLAPLPYS